MSSSNSTPASSTPRPTEHGRFMVLLDNVGPDLRTIVDILAVITPLEHHQIEMALQSHKPFQVRIGLTHMAARSIRDRLAAAGASVSIEEHLDN